MVPVPLSRLAEAVGIGHRELVSLVGGGGKTSSLFALGRQLGGRTVLTTTTKMGSEQTAGFTVLDGPDDARVRIALDRGPVVVRSRVDGHKAVGVAPERCDAWFADPWLVDHVVVEADGAKKRPFKAPRALEPVIPSATTLVLAHIGADALGRVILDQCQRPLRVAAAAGCRPGERLTPDRAARVLLDERGSRKGLPPGARFVVVVTKVGSGNRQLVEDLATELAGAAPLVAVAYAPAT